MKNRVVVKGNLVDVVKREIFKAELHVVAGRIEKIVPVEDCPDLYILPGIVDSHVHIESSMLAPRQFARLAVKHGTVAVVSDPHEIANVLGVEGINFMVDEGRKVPFKFYFGVPSCVPATSFENSGFVIDSTAVDKLLERKEFLYLSEVMNFPGVIFGDKEVHSKLNSARTRNKPIDGHAPGLSGKDLSTYASSGINTDHETTSVLEAVEKIKNGIKLQIREGSAAKSFDVLIPVIKSYPNEVMFCTDDCHPDDLVERHIMDLIRRGVKKGYDLFDLLASATIVPIKHYGLELGLLQVNDCADFCIVKDLVDFEVVQTHVNGELVYDGEQSLIEEADVVALNHFNCRPVSLDDIQLKMSGGKAKVMVAYDGDLFTGMELAVPKLVNGFIASDPERDILKIVVVNRYNPSKPIVGLIKNFGLHQGAIAESIAHDSHNIIAVGVSDEDILMAINHVVEMKGGIAACCSGNVHSIALPIAGLMTNENGQDVAKKYKLLNQLPKEWGCNLHAPFMTLSFMALLVIPKLKIGDKGLFDGEAFELTNLFV
jgi:adenine deaminase